MGRYLWKQLDFQREFLLKFCIDHNIALPQQWQKITSYNLRKANGRQILYHYPNIQTALLTIFPEHKQFLESNKSHSKTFHPDYWNIKENQKNFLLQLHNELNFETVEELISLTKKEIIKQGGKYLLEHYKGNYIEVLKANFPNRNWPEFIHPLPQGFWKDIKSQRLYLDWISKTLEHKSMNEWYNVSNKTLIQHGARNLLKQYKSLYEALIKIYPEHNWNIFKFTPIGGIPKRYLEDISKRSEFFSYLEDQLQIKEPIDWYKYSTNDIKKLGGNHFLKMYDGSLANILKFYYPDNNWNFYKLRKKNYWISEENQKQFILDLLRDRNISVLDVDSISKITTSQIREYGGSGLLKYYPTVLNMFEHLLPSNKWKYDSREKIPKNYWGDINNVYLFLENECKNKFSIKTNDDWYRLSLNQLRMIQGGGNLINRFGSMYEVLKTAYPNITWDEEKFTRRDKKSSQRLLFLHLQSIFPTYEIIEDFKHPSLFQQQQDSFELDIFIPLLNLAFEYQGKHHYEDTPSFGPLELNVERDTRKIEFCKNQGIHLIHIPYLWNYKIETLKEKIPNHYLHNNILNKE